jgi:hypothetical protein
MPDGCPHTSASIRYWPGVRSAEKSAWRNSVAASGMRMWSGQAGFKDECVCRQRANPKRSAGHADRGHLGAARKVADLVHTDAAGVGDGVGCSIHRCCTFETACITRKLIPRQAGARRREKLSTIHDFAPLEVHRRDSGTQAGRGRRLTRLPFILRAPHNRGR